MELTQKEAARREQIGKMMFYAHTLSEVKCASDALLAWRQEHPEDFNILNGGEVLAHAEDFANEREAEGIALGLSESERRERERILVQASRVYSVAGVQKARAELLRWLDKCPADQNNAAYSLEHLNRSEALYSELEAALAECEAEEAAARIEVGRNPQLVAAR